MTDMPMFEQPEQRDAWVAENAIRWSAVYGNFKDRKRFEHETRSTVEAFARAYLVENATRPVMLYAQAPTGTWFHITNLK